MCLRLVCQHQPETKLSNVFAYVGEAATVTTASGPAPPIVTGSFGPLDLYESLLGEIDDQVATGSLSELDLKTTSSIGETTSQIDFLASALQEANRLLRINIPSSIYKQLEILKSSAGTTGEVVVNWEDLVNASSTLWSKIQPVFQVRDDLAKWIASIGTLTWFGEKTAAILGRVSDAVDKMLFAALGNFIKPVLWSVRKQIEEERAALLEKEKNANQDPELQKITLTAFLTFLPIYNFFAWIEKVCTDARSAQVAGAITNFTTRAVVSCWDDETAAVDAVIDTILQVFHHPFNADQSSEIQNSMFGAVQNWWSLKSADQRTKLLNLLRKETVSASKNSLLITRPWDYFNPRGFSCGPTAQPLIATVRQNLVDARAAGAVHMSDKAFAAAIERIEAKPTVEQPNPFDAFLSLVPARLATMFKGVAVQDVMAAPTMGNIAEDVIVGRMMKDEQ